MTDAEAADDLNLEIRGSIRDLPSSEFLGIVSGSWPNAQDDRDYIAAILASDRGAIPSTQLGVRDKLAGGGGAIFSGPTSTALNAAWGVMISRAEELNLGNVRAGTVQQARAL